MAARLYLAWPNDTTSQAGEGDHRVADKDSCTRADRGERWRVPKQLPRDTSDRLVAYQTVMRDYLPTEERARYESGMQAWLEALPAGQAFWIEMEVTPGAQTGGPSAEITVHARGEDFLPLSVK
jgi:hypothetical protein